MVTMQLILASSIDDKVWKGEVGTRWKDRHAQNVIGRNRREEIHLKLQMLKENMGGE